MNHAIFQRFVTQIHLPQRQIASLLLLNREKPPQPLCHSHSLLSYMERDMGEMTMLHSLSETPHIDPSKTALHPKMCRKTMAKHYAALLQQCSVCCHITDMLFPLECVVTHSPALYQPSVLINKWQNSPRWSAFLEPYHLSFSKIKQTRMGELGLVQLLRFTFGFICPTHS